MPRFEVTSFWHGIKNGTTFCNRDNLESVIRKETVSGNSVSVLDTESGGFFEALHQDEAEQVAKDVDLFVQRQREKLANLQRQLATA